MSNKLIFVPSGRLGNAIFRYMACALVNIINPALEYTLLADYHPESEDQNFTYYQGVDSEGGDAYRDKIMDPDCMEKKASEDPSILGYNTLGFFKNVIDLQHLISNNYINKENGHGLYVKKTLTISDNTFFQMFYKNLEYLNVYMNGFFQFGYIYLNYKQQILNYMKMHQDKHVIQTDLKERFLVRDILVDQHLAQDKRYQVAIHIRLDDFNGRPDYIAVEHYLRLFETLERNIPSFAEQKICIVYKPSTRTSDNDYICKCLHWFDTKEIPVRVESNDLLTDFNIMKQAKILICSMSTLAWTAAYLSAHIEQCYMPNYHFYTNPERKMFFFHKPIENTILYNVETTPSLLGQIKTQLVTLPAYAERLAKLNSLNQQLAEIGLDAKIYNGVHGKDIHIAEAASQITQLKHITWKETTYLYDMRIRLNGNPMTHGEFGCAWSHLNLLQELLNEDTIVNYYLILEDDVELIQPLSELYTLLQHVPIDADMCHLAKSDWHPFIKTQQTNAYFFECEKRFFNKTTAYLVSRKGAAKILAYTKSSINVPIDDLFNMIYRLTPDFRFYVPTTYFFKEQDNVSSSIGAINSALSSAETP